MLSTMKLSPITVMGKQQMRKVKTIITSLTDKPESYDFQSAVDWKGMGLTDYTFIIKNPMDLGTVIDKLRMEKYRYVEEALDDIQMVWDNCKTYNHQETWIYKTAEQLERVFKKMVKNYLPSIPITVPGRNPGLGNRNEEKRPSINNNLFEQEEEEQVSYHQKMKFQEKLKHLSQEDLGKIVQMILEKCPSAFQQEDSDSAAILADNIDAVTFQELNLFIRQMNEEFEDKMVKKVKA